MTTLDPDRPDLHHFDSPDEGTIPSVIEFADSPDTLNTVRHLTTPLVTDGYPISADLLALYWRHGVKVVGA